jgi:hypothetical protein
VPKINIRRQWQRQQYYQINVVGVNEHDRSVVIRFLRMQFCGKKESVPFGSVPEAACRIPPP